MKKPFLQLLKHMERTGRIPGALSGLCSYIFYHSFADSIERTVFNYFKPTLDDERALAKEGKNVVYWGSDNRSDMIGIATDLRKTIIAFCAAINDEL